MESKRKYKGKIVYDKQMEDLRIKYKNWKIMKKNTKSPFFIIYKDFKYTHLQHISGGALKLYVYLGLHVNTFTGECWHSSESISNFFQVDIRTVKKWFAELENEKLIVRIQTGFKRVANTFLLPYEHTNEHNQTEDLF